jgi:hypothetical protein
VVTALAKVGWQGALGETIVAAMVPLTATAGPVATAVAAVVVTEVVVASIAGMGIPTPIVDDIRKAHLPKAEDSDERLVGHTGIHVP